MKYSKLVFQEVSDEQSIAAHDLEMGYKIQVTFDNQERVNNCILYNDKGSIVDNEEGLDFRGVEDFIEKSEDLVIEMKETMMAMNMPG